MEARADGIQAQLDVNVQALRAGVARLRSVAGAPVANVPAAENVLYQAENWV